MTNHLAEDQDEAADPWQTHPIEAQPILLTMPQVAALCQVSIRTVREWTYLPGFPVMRSTRQVRIHARKLDEWLADRSVAEKENAA
jgi:hypothetical protein